MQTGDCIIHNIWNGHRKDKKVHYKEYHYLWFNLATAAISSGEFHQQLALSQNFV